MALNNLIGVDCAYFAGDKDVDAIVEIITLAKRMENTINRQTAEIERLQKYNSDVAYRHYNDGIKDFATGLKAIYTCDKRYDRPNAHTMLIKLFENIDKLQKQLAGDPDGR